MAVMQQTVCPPLSLRARGPEEDIPPNGTVLSFAARLERCSAFYKETDIKISNLINTSLAVISASAAGNCLDNAVVMSQPAEHWQFPVSHRHWQHGQQREIIERAAKLCQAKPE